MTKRLFILVCWLLTLSPAIAASRVIDFQHWQTSKGSKVFYYHAPQVPIVDLFVTFYAGSARDGEKAGLAAMTNELLAQGAAGLNADQIALAFENVGADFDSDVDRDTAGMRLRSLSDEKYLKPALETFKLVLSQPAFPDKDFKRLQASQLATIKFSEQSPQTVAKNQFFKSLYQNSSYGSPIIGQHNTVAKLTTEECKRFYQQYYVTNNAVIVMVGDLSLQQAKDMAEQLTADMKPGKKAPSLTPADMQEASQTVNIDFPSSQTVIWLGQIGLSRDTPDYFPITVGNYTLGGGTLVSRLSKNVREDRGLSYAIWSQFYLLASPGPFVISLGTKNSQTEEALTITQQTLQRFIKEGPTEQELNDAKKNLIGSFPLALNSNRKIANVLNAIGVYDLPLDYLDTYRDNVSKVTQQQVKKAFQQHIHPNKLLTVTVGKDDKQA